MALANYADLQASVANWLKRADLTANIPDLITLCEARIARDLRIRSQVAFTTLSVNANTQTVALPTDWLQMDNLSIQSSPNVNLKFVNLEVLDTNFPSNGTSGIPNYYCIEGNNILLGPVPDKNYTLDVYYYQRMNLANSGTNWLMTNHPNIYLFGTLAEAAPFIMNDERVALWEGKYQGGVQALQNADDKSQFSGSSIRVRNL